MMMFSANCLPAVAAVVVAGSAMSVDNAGERIADDVDDAQVVNVVAVCGEYVVACTGTFSLT